MDETSRRAALRALYELPGHLLWRAAARVSSEAHSMLPGDADFHAYAALLALADREPQSQRSLAAALAVSTTTLTSVAQALHRDGLVERVRDRADRRCYSLTRASAAGATMRRWSADVERLERHLTTPLSEADGERLRELLTAVIADQPRSLTPPALLSSTGFLLTRAHQRAHREFATALTPLGIEPRDFGTMRCLQVAGRVTQGDVASLLDVSPASVVQIVDGLETSGLVVRQRGVEDRRVYLLHLSARAEDVLAESSELSDHVLEDRLGGPGSQRRRDLVRLVGTLLGGGADAGVADS
jgi:DNA-binding MarR family transcriptional regulator